MFTLGQKLKMTVFGTSHNSCIGVVVEGLKAGLTIDEELVKKMLARRKPNFSDASTSRNETDEYQIVSGLFCGKTNGSPLVAIFENKDKKSKDYEQFIPRPSHSDYVAFTKYGGFNDYRGGGFFSGRMTACMVFAGAIAMQLLEEKHIFVNAKIKEMGDVESAKAAGDSVGGQVECVVKNLPVGVGEPIFDSLESVISHALFSIPAVVGVSFGAGFDVCKMKGSENNDQMEVVDGKVSFKTNNSGGILGGISNGMPLKINVAIKPTPSIYLEQDSIDLYSMNNTKLKIEGRHDVCIVPRAVPVIEAMTAFAVYNLIIN